ncbi:MAG TPA: Dabb family protein [Dyadobacter sp.]|jgi:hypothetical protein|nr:Dabb family protein [Dyadobacter sp.]
MKLRLLFLAGLLMIGSMAFVSPKSTPPKKMLRHVVLFKFKDSATPAQVKEVEDAFRKLPTKIKEIKGFEWGTENSPEGLSQGFTHVFFVTFDSEEGRAAYLPHPEHKAFGKVLQPYLDKVLVVDYWTKE